MAHPVGSSSRIPGLGHEMSALRDRNTGPRTADAPFATSIGWGDIELSKVLYGRRTEITSSEAANTT
jgi:hypothetical protein